MLWVAFSSLEHGDPRRLYHGFDFEGKLCGVNETVVDKPLLYWPDSNRMDLPVCVDKCPGTEVHGIDVPRETVVVTSGTDYVRTEIMRQKATLMTYPSKEVAGRFCVPDSANMNAANVSAAIVREEEFSSFSVLIKTYKDIENAWSILLFMLPVSMAVGYGYVFLLRFAARMVLNVVLAALILGSGALSFYSLYYVSEDDSRAHEVLGKFVDNTRDVLWIVGFASAVLCFLLLCAGWSMLHKLERISAVVEAAGDTMWSVQLLLCMPVFEVLLKLAYTVTWIFFASYVISDGDIKGTYVDVAGRRIDGMVRTFSYSATQKLCIILYCVGYFWGLEFISMLFKFVDSFAVAMWYFQSCRADMSKPEILPQVWIDGFFYALVYHIGSLSIGAAVTIALYIFIPIHVVSEFFLLKSQTSLNPVVKAMVYSCTCCIKCTQELLVHGIRNAFVIHLPDPGPP
jgi:hypothetical protein